MTTTLSLSNVHSDSTTRRSLSALSLAVAKSKRIVVVTGAGISCSCGIPDFRSSDGLYNLVKQQYPNTVLKGRDLFDASLFRDPTSTSVFYTFISKLKQSIDTVSPSPTHHFIKALDTKGKLLRSYTQNIDGLEERVGLLGSSSEEVKSNGKGKSKIKLKEVRNVQLHGDIRRVRCTICSAIFPFAGEHMSEFLQGIAPNCPDCESRSAARVARSARALKIGTLRPAIVLYDEPHPLGDEIGSIESADLARKPDLLIIMGTSLKVHGLKKLVKEFAKVVHASSPTVANSSKSVSSNALKRIVIFVNKTPPSAEWDDVIDYHVEGETDLWAGRVLEDWKTMRPADWEIQTTLDGVAENAPIFKASKENAAANTTKNTKNAKKSRRKQPNDENKANSPQFTKPQPSSDSRPTSTIKAPPLSPSKRRGNTPHYSSPECSPSKKKLSQPKHDIPNEERRLLFGPSRNSNRGTIPTDDEFDFREIAPLKPYKRTSSQSSLQGLEDEVQAATLADRLDSDL